MYIVKRSLWNSNFPDIPLNIIVDIDLKKGIVWIIIPLDEWYTTKSIPLMRKL